MEQRAAAYRAYIRRSNTVADTWSDQFEADSECTCLPSFTKTETLRRLRVGAKLIRQADPSLGRNFRT